jgi:hypothetical protein
MIDAEHLTAPMTRSGSLSGKFGGRLGTRNRLIYCDLTNFDLAWQLFNCEYRLSIGIRPKIILDSPANSNALFV